MRGVARKGAVLALKAIQFLAIALTALSLVPAGAHLFALPHKINLAAEQYFVVQGIYRRWDLFAFVLIPAVIANLVLAIMLRSQTAPFRMALFAAFCMIAVLAVFFVRVYPANVATDMWTTIPADWETLRRQWEYGHAANAIITFAAFCAVTLAALTSRE